MENNASMHRGGLKGFGAEFMFNHFITGVHFYQLNDCCGIRLPIGERDDLNSNNFTVSCHDAAILYSSPRRTQSVYLLKLYKVIIVKYYQRIFTYIRSVTEFIFHSDNDTLSPRGIQRGIQLCFVMTALM